MKLPVLLLCAGTLSVAYALESSDTASASFYASDDGGFYTPEDIVSLWDHPSSPSSSYVEGTDSIKRFSSPSQLATFLSAYVLSLTPEQRRRLIASFDIDDTLGHPDNPLLAEPVYTANTLIAATLIPRVGKVDPYKRVFANHITLMTKECHMLPMDGTRKKNSMATLIGDLQSDDALAVAGTARSSHYAGVTEQQLLEHLGIDFSRTIRTMIKFGMISEKDAVHLPFERPTPALFRNGILYCSGRNSKAELLAEFLTHVKIDDPLIVHIDDRRFHLERMHEMFPDALLLHLDIKKHTENFLQPDELTQIELAKILAIPDDKLTEHKHTAYKKFKILGIDPTASETMLSKVFDGMLPFPKGTYISNKIEEIITQTLGETVDERTKAHITNILNIFIRNVQQSTPPFRFTANKDGGSQYVAMYLAQQDPEKDMVITDETGKVKYSPLPILFPVSLLYSDNAETLHSLVKHDDYPRPSVTFGRSVSYLDVSRGSPPQSPGPATSSGSRTSPLWCPTKDVRTPP
jgi:hypothetical protein